MKDKAIIWLSLVGMFALIGVIFNLLKYEVLPGGDYDRYLTTDNANREALRLLWEDPVISVGTLVLAVVLMMAIFASLTILKGGSKK